MPGIEFQPSALIDTDQYIDGLQLRITPADINESAYESVMFRRILPDDVRKVSAYAVESLITIVAVNDSAPDYSDISYELNDPGSVLAAQEGPKIRTVKLDFEGNVFEMPALPRRLWPRFSVGRITVGYLMRTDAEWKAMNQEISASAPSGWPQPKN